MTTVKISDLGGATLNAIDVGGFITPDFSKPAEETKRIFDNVPSFKFRDSDLMLCTYPKTGTNWLYEVISMILDKSAKQVESYKGMTMIEYQSPEDVEKMPSPRVINSHFPYRFLPSENMKAKQIKTILCCRNPKDTAVSFYNHVKGIKSYEYEGKWSDWLPVYLQGKLEYGKYTDYLLEWEKAIQAGVGYPLHLMYYEDLKLVRPDFKPFIISHLNSSNESDQANMLFTNGMEELDKLLKFLGVHLEEQLQKDIIEMCGFDKMASTKVPEEFAELFFKRDFKFLRKGQVGDWKNWFTVAQNELFEETWKKEMEDSNLSKFTYVDPNV